MPSPWTSRHRICHALLLACLATAGLANAAAMPAETVLSGLAGPVDFAVLPDRSVWWLEYYSGNVTRYDAATQERQVVFHVTPVVGGERGAVGLGVDQASADNGTFYLYYAVAAPGDEVGGINRLSRIEHGTETVLLTTTAAVRHNGGRIVILPDGTLFVSTGENDLGQPAQDPDSLLGKILHLNPDGSPAPGNPHGRLYSLGHRNVYGLAYDPASKRLFATENSNAERDEVNEILPGHNYGWPACEGTVLFDWAKQQGTDRPCTDATFTLPIGQFYPDTTAAPTGAAILDGHLYWASWNEGAIHRLDQGANGTWTDQRIYQYGGRINDLAASPSGHWLYYSNWTSILRIRVDPPALAPLAPLQGTVGSAVLATTSSTGRIPATGPVLLLLALGMAGFLAQRHRRPE
jgi:glucose/arabinose dehydrogenase